MVAEFVNSRTEVYQLQRLKPGQTHRSKAVGEGCRSTMMDGWIDETRESRYGNKSMILNLRLRDPSGRTHSPVL